MQRFADLGLNIYITELDMRLPNSIPDSIGFPQPKVYENVMRRCLERPACVAVHTWGMTDRHSWVPGFFPDYGKALPLDDNLEAKPVYYALQSAMLSEPSTDAACRFPLWDNIVLHFVRALAIFLPVLLDSFSFLFLSRGYHRTI